MSQTNKFCLCAKVQSPITDNSSQLPDRIPTMSAPFSTESIQDFSGLANQFVANTCSHNCDYTCKSNYGVHGRLTAYKQWWYDNLQLSKIIMSVLEDGYVISLCGRATELLFKEQC